MVPLLGAVIVSLFVLDTNGLQLETGSYEIRGFLKDENGRRVSDARVGTPLFQRIAATTVQHITEALKKIAVEQNTTAFVYDSWMQDIAPPRMAIQITALLPPFPEASTEAGTFRKLGGSLLRYCNPQVTGTYGFSSQPFVGADPPRLRDVKRRLELIEPLINVEPVEELYKEMLLMEDRANGVRRKSMTLEDQGLYLDIVREKTKLDRLLTTILHKKYPRQSGAAFRSKQRHAPTALPEPKTAYEIRGFLKNKGGRPLPYLVPGTTEFKQHETFVCEKIEDALNKIAAKQNASQEEYDCELEDIDPPRMVAIIKGTLPSYPGTTKKSAILRKIGRDLLKYITVESTEAYGFSSQPFVGFKNYTMDDINNRVKSITSLVNVENAGELQKELIVMEERANSTSQKTLTSDEKKLWNKVKRSIKRNNEDLEKLKSEERSSLTDQ